MPSWLSNLDYQWQSTAWRPWLEFLWDRNHLIRYDPRGCGLSDRDIDDLSFDSWVRDVDAVLDAAGLDRVSLIGICQGGAVAIRYAASRPDRVDRLVLYGTYARGRNRRDDVPLEPEKAKVMLEMLELGWADEDSAFMRSFATQFQPDGTLEHLRTWCKLQRQAASASSAVALTRIMFDINVMEDARKIRCPTLVAHVREDAVVPLEEGRILAREIPGASFLTFDSRNHFMLPKEPAWAELVDALDSFLPGLRESDELAAVLSMREQQVLRAVAEGLDNREIGTALDISEKTVRNHVSGILSKLGVPTRAKAIVRAIRAGLGPGEAGR
ncbi:alpha/beta hydrolase fold [Roseovarius azorensis]|uniref:Alpha/beta hydrolase fold n=1 Tax=Roseovarius azorensis TaxID=1287727 RepID=A0A1H7RK67_9RHOB|nr:alpha/beta fold hydrolase [Roseovarius azorensis]SEL60613.1 alpha/beta hydrolase fold [Roseovarius azorensis]